MYCMCMHLLVRKKKFLDEIRKYNIKKGDLHCIK